MSDVPSSPDSPVRKGLTPARITLAAALARAHVGPFAAPNATVISLKAGFEKREGDCKDKAILIDTMLREIGIEAGLLKCINDPLRT